MNTPCINCKHCKKHRHERDLDSHGLRCEHPDFYQEAEADCILGVRQGYQGSEPAFLARKIFTGRGHDFRTRVDHETDCPKFEPKPEPTSWWAALKKAWS